MRYERAELEIILLAEEDILTKSYELPIVPASEETAPEGEFSPGDF